MQECVKKLEKGEANGQYDHTFGAQANPRPKKFVFYCADFPEIG